MASIAQAEGPLHPEPGSARLDHRPSTSAKLIFLAILLGGLGYAGWSILNDTQGVGETLALGVFAFLGLALVIALGFEFVNGFHDTANAVATVIYTNSMPAPLAVLWSGSWNFIGVMTSSGAVAYTIVTLLPVDLILHVGSAAGFAMIFALLFAAVLWNLATWYVGLPNSSSHTLIGSVLGVGLANQLLSAGSHGGTSGVDWAQAEKVLSALLVSPLIGFAGALVLLLIMRAAIRVPKLYQAPEGDAPPPLLVRGLLVLTCTSVSFAHGSNDGQKGMGLIMLILIGCAPTAYALNRTMPASDMPAFVRSANAAAAAFEKRGGAVMPVDQARKVLTTTLEAREAKGPQADAAVASVSHALAAQVAAYPSLGQVPAQVAPNVRNDMYLVLDSSKLLTKKPDGFSAPEMKAIKDYQDWLERGTRFIPLWVKIAVALALGLGTMIGWKRIVITVGERIGKQHLTYAMGAAAELVTAGTIMGADRLGLTVSTTHILTSGVAGASIANGQGMQFRTIRNMALAWVLTLPVAMLLSGGLYWLMLTVVRAGGLH